MTPLLQQLLKFPAIISLVKTEQRKEAEKTPEVYYVMEKMSPTDDVWEHEVVVEEHTEVLFEDEVAPEFLSKEDVLSTTEKQTQKDKKSELKGEISVTDTSKRKETRVTKHRVIPKTEETLVVVQETKSDKDEEVATVEDKPTKEKTEEEFFVRSFKSPTEEITDERKDGTSVSHLPDKKDISKQPTRVTVKKERGITIKTESRERHKREKPEETIAVKEIESVKDIPSVKEADKTKPSPVIISTEATQQSEKLEIEVNTFTEVPYKEVDHGVQIISAIPEEKYSRTEKITEIAVEPDVTVKDKPTNVIPTYLKKVEEETSAKDEIQVKPPGISDSTKDETSATGQVSVKKHKPAEKKQEKPKPEDITEKEKDAEKPLVEKPKKSVTDIKPQRPRVMEQETELESVSAKTETEDKKKEESRDVPKTKEESFIIEDMVQTKPEEKKRISPQTPSRGTERQSNIMIIFIFNFSSLASTRSHHFSLSSQSTSFHLISKHLFTPYFHVHCVPRGL